MSKKYKSTLYNLYREKKTLKKQTTYGAYKWWLLDSCTTREDKFVYIKIYMYMNRYRKKEWENYLSFSSHKLLVENLCAGRKNYTDVSVHRNVSEDTHFLH